MADTEKFPSEMSSRGTVKVTDKLMIHNIDTGVTEYTTVAELLAALSTFAAGQIGFPAVQVPSADVNTLDDYEEGTFTPKLTFGNLAVGITYTVNQGLYTKVGNLVTVSGRVTLSNKGSSTGSVRIIDLPFVAADVDGAFTPVSLYLGVITFANQFMGFVYKGTSYIELREVTEAGAVTNLDDTNFANTSSIFFTCTYRVA